MAEWLEFQNLDDQEKKQLFNAIMKDANLKDFENSVENSSLRGLEEMINDVTKEEEIQYQNFECKEQMRKYENEDYRVKAFLMLITAGRKKKMWMPGKTVFDKRGGKYSDKVGGLGQIPGLQ